MTDQVKYTHKLKDARVLIIGGSSGIGFGVAEALVENGAHVIISSSNQGRVDKKVEELKKAYPSAASSRISGLTCDLGNEATLEANIVALLDKCGGPLDHIVHTAGDKLANLALDTVTMENLKQAGMVRFFSTILLGKHAPKYLRPGPNSSITLTTGTVSERPSPGWGVINGYATGLHGVCRALALDLKPIRVNLVSPGAVVTELWETFGLSEEQRQKHYEKFAQVMPVGSVGKPEQIAEAYLYLIKDTNATGSMISTNGGALLMGPP